jgi:hypothetical protein
LTESALFHTDNDDDDDDDDDEFEEAGFEPSSSKNAEKDSSTGTSCFKNRLESASLRDTAGFIINDQLFCGFCGDLFVIPYQLT